MLLTAVILPAILVSSFHHHELLPEPQCIDCVHHVPHGHVSGIQHTDDCLVCQFLSISWLTVSDEPLAIPVLRTILLGESPCQASDFLFFQHLSTRAPPAVFC